MTQRGFLLHLRYLSPKGNIANGCTKNPTVNLTVSAICAFYLDLSDCSTLLRIAPFSATSYLLM